MRVDPALSHNGAVWQRSGGGDGNPLPVARRGRRGEILGGRVSGVVGGDPVYWRQPDLQNFRVQYPKKVLENWESMQYNKYHDQFLELDTKRKLLRKNLAELEGTQGWYKKFDLSAAATTVGHAKRSTAEFINEIGQLDPKIFKQASEVTRLREKASLGWNPKYWFSAERATFKVDLSNKIAELSQLQKRLDWLQTQTKIQSDTVARVEGELKKYNKHDSLECDAKISALNQEISAFATRLQEVCRQRDELDVQLSAPLIELKKFTSQRSSVATDISRAQSMDDEMSRAANGYERAQIHERSKQTFGDPSPRKVKVFKERELESIDRNIKKLQTRLEAIAEKSSRVIRRLVIDGNNMCYLHSPRRFLGLSALRPLANALAEKHEVLVVFDASIREQLRKNDRQISDCFSNRVRVHIVATGQKADESLLRIASEKDDWVISGDRFGEYPEMPAVKNKRLIRHEILEGKVLINDLGVDVCY